VGAIVSPLSSNSLGSYVLQALLAAFAIIDVDGRAVGRRPGADTKPAIPVYGYPGGEGITLLVLQSPVSPSMY
jgi:hypothetical protein